MCEAGVLYVVILSMTGIEQRFSVQEVTMILVQQFFFSKILPIWKSTNWKLCLNKTAQIGWDKFPLPSLAWVRPAPVTVWGHFPPTWARTARDSFCLMSFMVRQSTLSPKQYALRFLCWIILCRKFFLNSCHRGVCHVELSNVTREDYYRLSIHALSGPKPECKITNFS